MKRITPVLVFACFSLSLLSQTKQPSSKGTGGKPAEIVEVNPSRPMNAPKIAQTAGPFGLEAGMTKEAIVAKVGQKSVAKIEGDILTLTTVPSPHPDFDEYLLIVSPANGLVKVAAVSKDIETNSSGEQLRDKYAQLLGSLKSKYGPQPTVDVDQLDEGSIWTDAGDWMMGLLKKERKLLAVWDKPTLQKGAAALPAHLDSLEIQAHADGPYKGYIAISYEFDAYDQYSAERKAKKDSVF